MHACLVMILQYYEAGMGKTYCLLFKPKAVVFLTGVCTIAADTGWPTETAGNTPPKTAPLLC
jgi:hypothetical protein